jgi:four helix bundle protein
LKEANETDYWLELLYKTNYITEDIYKDYTSICTEIRVTLISSIKTAKQNAESK